MAFVNDTFTDTTGNNLNTHTADSGATWAKNGAVTGDGIIEANRVRGNSTTLEALYYASATPATADYDVSADLKEISLNGGGYGVSGRQDTVAYTHYLSHQDITSNTANLYKGVAGAYTLLGSIAHTFNTNDVNNRKLTMRGTTIAAYIDSTLVASVTDSAITAAGRAGIYFGVSNAIPSATVGTHIDNFLAINADVTVAITGISSASGIGSVASSRTVPVTGSSSSASAGSLTPSNTVFISGLSSTVAAGNVTETHGGTVGITGITVVVSAGAVTATVPAVVGAANMFIQTNPVQGQGFDQTQPSPAAQAVSTTLSGGQTFAQTTPAVTTQAKAQNDPSNPNFGQQP